MVATTKQGGNPITVHGLVVPKEWDDNGKPLTLSVATFTEEEYEIDKDASGRLLEFLGKEVVLRGNMEESGKTKFLRDCSILKIKSTLTSSR
jgi:hypothetical protein